MGERLLKCKMGMMYMAVDTVCFHLLFDCGESNYWRPWGVLGINRVKFWCAVIV